MPPTEEPSTPRQDVTRILAEASAGDRQAVDRLLPIVYAELRALAQSFLAAERPGHTLQATALVHEAFLRLVDQRDTQWQSRAHFFAIAAQAIRRILVDHARTRNRAKRGGGRSRVPLDEAPPIPADTDVDILALNDALSRLAELSERQARIVELKFFAGMRMKEIAEVMGISVRTAEADWTMAKAWLRREIEDEDDPQHNTNPR